MKVKGCGILGYPFRALHLLPFLVIRFRFDVFSDLARKTENLCRTKIKVPLYLWMERDRCNRVPPLTKLIEQCSYMWQNLSLYVRFVEIFPIPSLFSMISFIYAELCTFLPVFWINQSVHWLLNSFQIEVYITVFLLFLLRRQVHKCQIRLGKYI